MLLAQAIEDRHLKTIRIFMVITMGRSTRFKDVRTQSLLRRMCGKYQVVSAGHRILLQVGLQKISEQLALSRYFAQYQIRTNGFLKYSVDNFKLIFVYKLKTYFKSYDGRRDNVRTGCIGSYILKGFIVRNTKINV